MSSLAMILAALVEELPSLVTEGEAVFNSVAKGEGGPQKVANAASALSQLASTAATVAAAATPPNPAPAPAAGATE